MYVNYNAYTQDRMKRIEDALERSGIKMWEVSSELHAIRT